MLENPSEKVRNCLRHAEQCGHRAKIEPDPNLARDYLDMERRWLSLARSYQFSESFNVFQQEKARRSDRKIVNRLAHKIAE
jgi:hypothetical protein